MPGSELLDGKEAGRQETGPAAGLAVLRELRDTVHPTWHQAYLLHTGVPAQETGSTGSGPASERRPSIVATLQRIPVEIETSPHGKDTTMSLTEHTVPIVHQCGHRELFDVTPEEERRGIRQQLAATLCITCLSRDRADKALARGDLQVAQEEATIWAETAATATDDRRDGLAASLWLFAG